MYRFLELETQFWLDCLHKKRAIHFYSYNCIHATFSYLFYYFVTLKWYIRYRQRITKEKCMCYLSNHLRASLEESQLRRNCAKRFVIKLYFYIGSNQNHTRVILL